MNDERVVELWPTEAGWALLPRAIPVRAQIAQAAGMPPAEIAALRDALIVLAMRLRVAE